MPSGHRRPLIGVTGPDVPVAPGRIAATWLLRLQGARVRPLAAGDGPLTDLDGVVVTGGSDIDPGLYLEAGGPWVVKDPERDEFELGVLAHARANDLPVLGICRGMQLINVSRAGSLHEDITELRRVTSNRPSLVPRKPVAIVRDSRLASVLGRTRIRVNSLHHQAVDRVGAGLKIVARDDDHIVQGIEADDDRFVMGVQWHPEYLGFSGAQRRLFRALIDAARR